MDTVFFPTRRSPSTKTPFFLCLFLCRKENQFCLLFLFHSSFPLSQTQHNNLVFLTGHAGCMSLFWDTPRSWWCRTTLKKLLVFKTTKPSSCSNVWTSSWSNVYYYKITICLQYIYLIKNPFFRFSSYYHFLKTGKLATFFKESFVYFSNLCLINSWIMVFFLSWKYLYFLAPYR